MMRWLVPAVMLAGTICLPLISVAEGDSARGGGFHRPLQIDLASLTLTPEEVESVGLDHFGLAAQSSLRDAEAESDLGSGGDPELAAELLAAYRADGFRFRYVGGLLRPSLPLQRLSSGLIAAEQRLNTSVAEYATAEGAESSFNLLEGELDEWRGDDIAGGVIGDESEMTRSYGRVAGTRSRIPRLELKFRSGNFI